VTADPDEQFFFVTGAESTRSWCSTMRRIAHQRRTRMVSWDTCPRPTICSYGLSSSATSSGHFHSHPVRRGLDGAVGDRPRLPEASGERRPLGADGIFSRDGYVRFVRLDQNFEIEIYGEGVANHAPGIYRLTTSIELEGTAIPEPRIASG